jgi:hypothetical protein
VIIPRVPVGEPTRQTVGAMDCLGSEGGRAIKGNQKLLPKDPETVAQVVVFQALKDLEKDRVERARGNRIEEGADLVVTGHLLDAKQGLGVMASLTGLELALVLQKRWRLREEDAKGASSSIVHRVTGIGAGLTMVREMRDALVQDRLESIEA